MTFADVVKVGAAVIVSLGGGGAIVFGLSGFLGKVWVDRLKGDIDARLHRLDSALKHHNFLLQRFSEYELEGIVECWRAARACLPLMNATRPIDSGTDEHVLAANAKALSDAHNVLIAVAAKHEPFLPADVVATLDAIANTVRLELSNIQHHQPFVGDWWEAGERNAREVERLCAVLLKQVKERSTELRSEQESED